MNLRACNILFKILAGYLIICVVLTTIAAGSLALIRTTELEEKYSSKNTPFLVRVPAIAIGAVNLYSSRLAYFFNPALFAVVEHSLNTPLSFLDRCRFDNFIRSGTMIVGIVDVPEIGQRGAHLRSYTEDGVLVEKVCPLDICEIEDVRLMLKVKDYKITETKILKNSLITLQALIYLKTALAVHYILEG